MEIPAEVAKMVIGQGGKSIKDLQERTGAYVLIHKPEPGEPAGNSRQVRVKGRVASVDVAVAELRRKVMEFEYNRGGYDDRARGGAAPYGAPGGTAIRATPGRVSARRAAAATWRRTLSAPPSTAA